MQFCATSEPNMGNARNEEKDPCIHEFVHLTLTGRDLDVDRYQLHNRLVDTTGAGRDVPVPPGSR